MPHQIKSMEKQKAGRRSKYANGSIIKAFRIPADAVKEVTLKIYQILKSYEQRN